MVCVLNVCMCVILLLLTCFVVCQLACLWADWLITVSWVCLFIMMVVGMGFGVQVFGLDRFSLKCLDFVIAGG